MRDLVVHSPSGLVLDFAADDFGGDEHAAIIQKWQGGPHKAEKGDFVCHFHRKAERPELYLQQRGDQIIAAHWPESGLADTHKIVHGISDEHKRQVEYIRRAGVDAGFDVGVEVSLPTKVRSDAVIYGPEVHMGVEVQRSGLTALAAKIRTTKARRAGVQPVWFHDSLARPKWLGEVPGVRMNPTISWDGIPHPRTVTVTSGVRSIIVVRCRDHISPCPRRRYGCNEWHAFHEPRGVYVDDLAERYPAGDLVAIRYWRFNGDKYVLIVDTVDKQRYEEVIGRSAELPLRERQLRRVQPLGRIECRVDAGSDGMREQQQGWTFPPYIPAPRCEVHGMAMIQLVPGKHYCRFCFQVLTGGPHA